MKEGQVTFGEYLGLETKRTDDGAEVRLESTERALNSLGVAHGGVICSLVDHAIGAAVAFALGRSRRAVTAELKVNFLAPITAGTVIARGRLIRGGRRRIVGGAEVVDRTGRGRGPGAGG